ncbi:trophoblast glycoprotein-like [Amphibalanus amphitrite]|uniref:trophoblast glycoprotein-like n=1 Tax=Amphibalanus amphitrite TaxID=1232801 RepID=UPI001C91C5B7|nr:trophoblast glycoprotein-like [Amphibalanus amphitrite]
MKLRLVLLLAMVLAVMLPPALGKISKKPTSDKKSILRSYTKETSTKTTAGSTIKFDDTDEDDDDYLDDEDYDEDYYDDDYDYLDDDTVYDTDHTGCPTPFLARCQCGDMNHLGEIKFVVNCTNTGFTNASMLGALPDDTEVLIFTGNFLEVLPTNVFGTMAKFEDLEYIDMSNNGIKEIKGKSFHRVSNVKTLILNHNDLYIVEKKHHPRVFSNFDNLEALHLTNAFTEKVDSKWYMVSLEIIFQGSRLDKLKRLHLEQNEIWSLRDPDTFCKLPSLEGLYLGSNRLYDIDMNLLCLDKLTYIDLEYNSIRRLNHNATSQLDQMVVKNPSFSVKLIGNPFVCDCDIRPFYQWMRTTRVELLRSADYRCFEGRPASNENLPILELQTTECEPAPAARTSASSVVLGILVFVMCVLLVVVLYMHRHRLVQRAKRLQPHMQVAIRNLKRSRQYANIQHEDAPEVEV